VWAFCILLYEALLGHVPFTDTNYHRLLRRIVEEPIPSFSRVGVRDDTLWGIIEKGLRKDPNERFDSMRSLGVSLARWLLDVGITEDVGHGSVRATWLQGSTTDPRRRMDSCVDTAETLASIPSEPPPARLSLAAAFQRRYRTTRLGWFAAIFFGSVLGTVLAKSWLTNAGSPHAPASGVPVPTLVVPKQVETQASPAMAHEQPAAMPAAQRATSVAQTRPDNASVAATNPTNLAPARAMGQRSGVARSTDTASPRSSRSASPTKAAPASLDIKTDF
jgi:hypothetical protein